ncbi:MAG: ROK family protein [Phycisphaeraceae bacterium]
MQQVSDTTDGKTSVPRWASRSAVTGARQRRLLAALWKAKSLSRRELHDQTGIRPNTITLDVNTLLSCGVLSEKDSPTGQRGRPSVPLEINRGQRDVVGLAIEPHRVGVARLNLGGDVLETRQETGARDPHAIVTTARAMLKSFMRDSTLSVGFSATGSVDPINRCSLHGSAWSKTDTISLQSIYEVAGDRPLILENDMHALSARWGLHRKIAQDEDTLLVDFEDGRLGASLLIDGRPNRGCITAANELGHTRLPIETDLCHCGKIGCLERICSTPFLQRYGGESGTLDQRAADYDGTDETMTQLIDLLAMGIANAVSFSRVHRLVLVSELTRHPRFTEALIASIRRQVVSDVEPHIKIEVWQQVAGQAAETAGWLAMANLFMEGWGEATDLTQLCHADEPADANK